MPADLPADSVDHRTGPGVRGNSAVAAGVIPPKVLAALRRFRVVAIAEGIALLVLVALMLVEYVFHGGKLIPLWPQFHGLVFFLYFLLTLDLGFKARWKPVGTLLIVLAGVVPLVSFWAEQVVTRKVRAGQRL